MAYASLATGRRDQHSSCFRLVDSKITTQMPAASLQTYLTDTRPLLFPFPFAANPCSPVPYRVLYSISDVYTLPCDHAGGTFWYHPHHHGSTSLQMGGGAMGALIVEDRVDVHGIPDQIADMPEFVVTIQEMDPDLTAFDRDASGGELYTTTATQTCGLLVA